MGLRLVAHYYDRDEALIVRSVLDAAGLVAFVENEQQIAIDPFRSIALGGYRIVVPEAELALALDVIAEARRDRSYEGERLSKHHMIVPHLLATLLLGWFWIWCFPLRRYAWRKA